MVVVLGDINRSLRQAASASSQQQTADCSQSQTAEGALHSPTLLSPLRLSNAEELSPGGGLLRRYRTRLRQLVWRQNFAALGPTLVLLGESFNQVGMLARHVVQFRPVG